MSVHEPDGVDDVVAGAARMAVTAGGFALEEHARRTAEAARARQAGAVRDVEVARRRADAVERVDAAVPAADPAREVTAVLDAPPVLRPEPAQQAEAQAARARDRADVAVSTPLLRDPAPAPVAAGKAVLPDIGTLIPRHDPAAARARLAHVPDRAAVEAVVLASAHQARPAGQAPTTTRTPAGSGSRARAAGRDPERTRHR